MGKRCRFRTGISFCAVWGIDLLHATIIKNCSAAWMESYIRWCGGTILSASCHFSGMPHQVKIRSVKNSELFWQKPWFFCDILKLLPNGRKFAIFWRAFLVAWASVCYDVFARSVQSLRSFPFCRKALTASQRGARCIATACSLSSNGVPVATPGGPPWSAPTFSMAKNSVFLSRFQLFRSSEFRIWSVKFLILLWQE